VRTNGEPTDRARPVPGVQPEGHTMIAVPSQRAPLRPTRRAVLAGLAAGAGAVAVGVAAGPAGAATVLSQQAPQLARQRVRTRLASGWRYADGDPAGAERPVFDDSRWAAVSLPHTWNAADSLDDAAGYRRGPGWYRLALAVTDRPPGTRLYLYFEGANQVADVFVQGVRVGGHVGGYTAFCVEVTEQLSALAVGAAATVAVRVDNGHDDDIPPFSADFTFYGGLYRTVWLIATDAVHLTMTDHASAGVRVDTPAVGASSAAVRVRGVVVNDGPVLATAILTATVSDASGTAVSAASTAVILAPGRSADFELNPPALAAPHLWSPDSPYLYSVATASTVTPGPGGGPGSVDRVDLPLGVRWFSVEPAAGFYLNGASLPLRGTNRHQDRVGRGNAMSDADQVADLELIKAMGANVVRLAHYPQAPAVLDAADRLGLVLWEESPSVNQIVMSPGYTRNSLEMTREMVRQHANHPSIAFWGYMNEIFLRPPVPEPAGYEQAVVALARQLEDLVRAEDPTRLTAMAAHPSSRYGSSGLADVPMMLGWNLYLGWYTGTFDQLGPWLDAEHAAHPDRALFLSEYGADSDGRLHSVRPVRGDQSIEYQQRFLESYLAQLRSRPYLVGATQWSAFDFGSEARTGAVPHVNMKGLQYSDRTPKDVYHLYRAALGTAAVLHIASRDWSHRAGQGAAPAPGTPAQVVQEVTVYSNLDRVELFVRGTSLGTRSPGVARAARWSVPFRNGTNRLTARGVAADGRALDDAVDVDLVLRPAALRDPTSPFSRLSVNVGAGVQYTDPTGWVWVEDQPYATGGWGAVGGSAQAIDAAWVNGTAENPLYQTFRRNMSAYRFDVPDGAFDVTVRCVDPSMPGPGRRSFDVTLNGAVLAAGVDLVARAGVHGAHDVAGRVQVSGGAGLTVGFRSVVGMPVVSGIDVRKV